MTVPDDEISCIGVSVTFKDAYRGTGHLEWHIFLCSGPNHHKKKKKKKKKIINEKITITSIVLSWFKIFKLNRFFFNGLKVRFEIEIKVKNLLGISFKVCVYLGTKIQENIVFFDDRDADIDADTLMNRLFQTLIQGSKDPNKYV